MKTLFVSLAAFAAVSSAALASDHGDLRDSDTYFGKFSTQNKVKSYATDGNAFVIVKKGKANLTAFERMNLISDENEHGGKSSGAGHGSESKL